MHTPGHGHSSSCVLHRGLQGSDKQLDGTTHVVNTGVEKRRPYTLVLAGYLEAYTGGITSAQALVMVSVNWQNDRL